jgi:hypothetical protein
MNSGTTVNRWQEGRVDRAKEHFELRYGSVKDCAWDEWLPAALIGLPFDGVVNVQFLVDPSDPLKEDVVSEVKREIQFYLFELKKPDPWLYAKYHCGTSSNVYSQVHWSFFGSAS